MRNGTEISQAWKEWIASADGKTASNPDTLHLTLSARNYLENRLHAAFMAGVKAAEEPHA